MIVRILILPTILMLLTGCVHELQLTPKPNSTRDIKDIKVTYILPNDIKDHSGTIHGITFSHYSSGTDSKMERLSITKENATLQVERRTDNSIAGSGTIYTVDTSLISKPNSKILTFTPKTQYSYQEGLILPFPVPNLDIEAFLSESTIDYKFEVNSEYPVDSVKANFDRILNKKSDGRYILDTDGKVIIMAEFYPYRTGSKIVIKSTLYNQKSSDNIIDIVKKIESLKMHVQSIAND